MQPTTSSIKTLVLWHSDRIETQYSGESAVLDFKLQELIKHDKVSGVLLNLANAVDPTTGYSLDCYYDCWDGNPPDPIDCAGFTCLGTDNEKANALAAAVRNYILDQVNNTYTNAQYLVLVGDDWQIPFYRMSDGTTIYPEGNYPVEVGLSTTTTVGSALNAGYFLTDNYYSELGPESSGLAGPHDLVYLNDLALGRLVETPAQIMGVINAFLSHNGQLNVMPDPDPLKKNRVLVTGYDFLHDSAFRIVQNFVQAVDNRGNVGMLWVTGEDLDGTGTPYGSSWGGPKTFDILLLDSDGDGLPDAWEDRYDCLDKIIYNNPDNDYDYDYLSHATEYLIGTNPCRGDTDGGGDNDGSEYNNGRNEQDPSDDDHLWIDFYKIPETTIYVIDWDYIVNEEIDGYYFVYRSSIKSMAPTDLVYGPLPNEQNFQEDDGPPCDPCCYYKVWNYQLDTPAPLVDVVVANSGPAAGGTAVTIYGENFVTGASVTFYGVPATNVVVNSSYQIKCTTPANPVGLCDVIVTNINNQEGVLEDGFEYY